MQCTVSSRSIASRILVISSVGAAAFFGLLMSAASLRAESDASSLAPWQAHPGVRPAGYLAEPEQRMSEPRSQPMRQIAEPPIYEGIESWSEQGAAGGSCQGCGDDCCTDECVFGACPDPFRCRLWFGAEYLMWWDKSNNLPPLGTTSVAGTPRAQAGILGLAGTSTVIGGQAADMGIRSGARLTFGCWMSPCWDEAIEASYLFFGSGKANYRQTSDDHSILARPFYNAQTFGQDSVVMAFPSEQTGWINAALSNELTSLSLLYRNVFMRSEFRQLSLLAGYRYSRFNENLAVDASTTYGARVGTIPVGTVIDTSDWFGANNEFHGGELGISAMSRYERWSFEFLAKLALGGTRSRLRVAGASTVSVPGQAPVQYADGMLALATNSGTTRESGFTAIPELGMNIGYMLSPQLKATVGYSFLYWSKVIRPADQIDMSLNPTQFQSGALVGYPAPESKFITTDYWAQGLNFGLDYRY